MAEKPTLLTSFRNGLQRIQSAFAEAQKQLLDPSEQPHFIDSIQNAVWKNHFKVIKRLGESIGNGAAESLKGKLEADPKMDYGNIKEALISKQLKLQDLGEKSSNNLNRMTQQIKPAFVQDGAIVLPTSTPTKDLHTVREK